MGFLVKNEEGLKRLGRSKSLWHSHNRMSGHDNAGKVHAMSYASTGTWQKLARIKGEDSIYRVVLTTVHAGLVYLQTGRYGPVFPVLKHQIEYVT